MSHHLINKESLRKWLNSMPETVLLMEIRTKVLALFHIYDEFEVEIDTAYEYFILHLISEGCKILKRKHHIVAITVNEKNYHIDYILSICKNRLNLLMKEMSQCEHVKTVPREHFTATPHVIPTSNLKAEKIESTSQEDKA